jgi:hypothetical protein
MKNTRAHLRLLDSNCNRDDKSARPGQPQDQLTYHGRQHIQSPAIAEKVALLLSAKIQTDSKKAIFAQANQSKEIILELLG